MEVVYLLFFYFLGVLTGAGAITLTIAIGHRAMMRKQKAQAPKESVTSRMKRVKDITNEQLDIQTATSGPQKNSMHGRYKNGLISRMKELEDQKTEILTSIVQDGFDPEITVMNESGAVTNIKLSEFLAQSGITIPQKGAKPPPKTSKFVVLKGGKDDNGSTTH